MKQSAVRYPELLCSLVIVGIMGALILPAGLGAREEKQRISCQENLKELGMVFKMYASESEGGLWPAMHGDEVYGEDDNCPGCLNTFDDADFFADMSAIYPQYLNDPGVLICPRDEDAALPLDQAIGRIVDDGSGSCPATCLDQITESDRSYVYVGWTLDQVEDGDPTILSALLGLTPTMPVNAQQAAVLSFAMIGTGASPFVGESPRIIDDLATPENEDNDRHLEEDIEVGRIPALGGVFATLNLGTGQGGTILRLREGIRHYLITDINDKAAGDRIAKELPVAWDHITSGAPTTPGVDLYNHREQGGANALYFDGHVEFCKFPGKFPATSSNANLISAFQ